MMLYMLDDLPTWTAHSEHQEVWAGPSWEGLYRTRTSPK
jgi:hypothetical protein